MLHAARQSNNKGRNSFFILKDLFEGVKVGIKTIHFAKESIFLRFPAGMERTFTVKGRRLVVFAIRKIYLPPQSIKQTILHSQRESPCQAIFVFLGFPTGMELPIVTKGRRPVTFSAVNVVCRRNLQNIRLSIPEGNLIFITFAHHNL